MPDKRDTDKRDREELDLQLDDLQLDRALATYADPEASPHLAARILAAIAPARPRRRWKPWIIAIPSIAIPAIAVLLLAVFLPLRHAHQNHPLSTTAAAPHLTSLVAPPPPPTAAAAHPLQAAEKARRPPIQPPEAEAALPKQEIFPTPTPLTPQEQALADLAARDPGVSQQAAEAEKQPVEPLEIAAIQIKPLNPPGKGQN